MTDGRLAVRATLRFKGLDRGDEVVVPRTLQVDALLAAGLLEQVGNGRRRAGIDAVDDFDDREAFAPGDLPPLGP